MKYAEIVPKNGSHYVVIDGQEYSRHDSVEIAEEGEMNLSMRSYSERARRGGALSKPADAQWNFSPNFNIPSSSQ